MTLGLGGFPIIETVKRRIVATASAAAIAVSGSGIANAQRNAPQPRGAKPQVTRLAGAESAAAQQTLSVLRREEMDRHRQRLAEKLAAELPTTSPTAIERALAVTDANPGISLARSTGRTEDEIEAAYEAMARRAREARLRA